jgi:hypothetical protein
LVARRRRRVQSRVCVSRHIPLAASPRSYHHRAANAARSTDMAKGQQRQPKEKKKPKSDKDKPKQMSAYKQAQTQGFGAPASPLGKKS